MSIWNKILIVLILLASLGLFYLSARALKTHQYWREQARDRQQELGWELDAQLVWTEGPDSAAVKAREEELQKLGPEAGQGMQQAKQQFEEQAKQLLTNMGSDAGLMERDVRLGRRQAEVALHEQLLQRGRVWIGCMPQQVQAGLVSVVIPIPGHQIEAQTVLWVFDKPDVQRRGSYLGQFTVTAVGGQDNRMLQLQPGVRMTAPQFKRLQQSAARGSPDWVLYEVMPTDSHEALAGLDEERLKQMLPQGTVQEYIMDGQITTAEEVKTLGLQGKVLAVDDDGNVIYVDQNTGKVVRVESGGEAGEARIVDEKGQEVADAQIAAKELQTGQGKYFRQLRDYDELFRYYHLQLARVDDQRDVTARHKAYIDAALKDAQAQVQYRQKERDQLVLDIKVGLRQRDAASAHLEAVRERLGAIQQAILRTIQANQAMAAEIARIQQEATRVIDERIRRMARAGAAE